MEIGWGTATVWMGLALLASFISIRFKLSVALVEILVGAAAGNLALLLNQNQLFGLHWSLESNEWIKFLAGFGSILLTFMAGAEIEPSILRRFFKESLSIGVASFAAPFIGAILYARYISGWDWSAAMICGIALSTTSVAVVYAVMIETGLNDIVILLAVKLVTKMVGVWPLTRMFRFGVRESNYTTLLMSTGLTFGTISAPFGLTHGYTDASGKLHTYINQEQYSILVTVVIASAIVPTMIAQKWFKPDLDPVIAPDVAPSSSIGPAPARMVPRQVRLDRLRFAKNDQAMGLATASLQHGSAIQGAKRCSPRSWSRSTARPPARRRWPRPSIWR